MDKSKESSVKIFIQLVRDKGSAGGSTWLPESPVGNPPRSSGGLARVVLPPALLAQAANGVVCQLKVTTPGIVSGSVLASSGALPVPLDPGPIPLAAGKQSTKVQAGGGHVATATLSVSRLFSPEAQAALAKSLAQQLLSQFRRPTTNGGGGSVEPAAGGVPPVLEALRPSRGWLPAANLDQAMAASDSEERTALRLAIDSRRWDCVRPLVEARCNLRVLAADFRSPLSAALEQGEQARLVADCDPSLTAEAKRVITDMCEVLKESRLAAQNGGGGSGGTAARRWEALAEALARHFAPPTGTVGERPAASAVDWTGDVFILALEHCPTGKARRLLLCAEGACAALWRVSLDRNLPDLARKLAVWIGLSVSSAGCAPAGFVSELSGSPSSSSTAPPPQSRRTLLDVQLDNGVEEAMLSRALRRGLTDDRWVKVARVMVHLGANVTSLDASGQSVLLLVLDKADSGHTGFRELLASLMLKLGDDVDQWDHPTVLVEENTAECPICMEVLWTSTPTAFVSYDQRNGREQNPHIICAHYFCFDCASQQYMKQQSQNVAEFQCPICRVKAREVMPLPDIAVNPRLWFQFLDVDGQGRIDKNTVVQTLEAMLPIDTEVLREALDQNVWAQWDQAGDGRITEREFFSPGGLLEWVRGHQHQLRAAQSRGAAPSISSDPEGWFRHWDVAKRGRLRRGELLRALSEEARVSSLEARRIDILKEGLELFFTKHADGDAVLRDRLLSQVAMDEMAALVQRVKDSGSGARGGEVNLAGV